MTSNRRINVVALAILCASSLSCGGGSEVAVTQHPNEPPASAPSTPQTPIEPPASSPNIPTVTLPTGVALMAGVIGGPGYRDGLGTEARFRLNGPSAIALGRDGNLYVADGFTIRKVTPNGLVSTLVGKTNVFGTTDGPVSIATFSGIYGMAADSAGNIYVLQAAENRYPGPTVIRKISVDGTVTTVPGIYSEGISITVDASGSLYVADGFVIRKVAADGAPIYSIFTSPTMMRLKSIAIDNAGNIIATTGYNYQGQGLIQISQTGITPGLSLPSQVSPTFIPLPVDQDSIQSIETDAIGNVYVLSASSSSKTTNVLKIGANGTVTKVAQTTNVEGVTANSKGIATISLASDLAIDNSGNVFLSNYRNIIQKIDKAGVITTIAGAEGVYGNVDAVGANARLSNSLAGLATDSTGNQYVTSIGDATLRKVDSTGKVTTIATRDGRLTPDSPVTLPSFTAPSAVATDLGGNVYVTDISRPEAPLTRVYQSSIRKITPDGQANTIAGSSVLGSEDGVGSAARFRDPLGIVADKAGNLYVTDTGNSTIRKITPAGIVTTLAGTVAAPGSLSSVDGVGANAQFTNVQGITIDAYGNLFVVDGTTVRKVTPDGIVTTFAGGEAGSVDAKGKDARFNRISSITSDMADNLYLPDVLGIRKITPDGTVTTLKWGEGVIFGYENALIPTGAITFVGPDSIMVTTPGAVVRAKIQ